MGPNSGAHHFCLKWNNHSSNLLKVFSRLLFSESFTDVTLAAGGRSIRAHKMVLCACSTYFEQLFLEHPEPNPIVIMRETSYSDLAAIIEFIYKGEINISQDHLGSLLKTAESLRVKGLAQVSAGSSSLSSEQGEIPPVSSQQHPPALVPLFQCHARQDEEHSEASSPVPSPPPTKRKRSSNVEKVEKEEPEAASREPGLHSIVAALDLRLADNCVQSSSAGNAVYEESETVRRIKLEKQETSCVFKGYPVYKFNDYVTHGTRQQFWDEPFTHAVMEGIQDRELDLKKGAEMLGVSYSTLYGRYRESHGYLRHAWNKSRERSSDSWWEAERDGDDQQDNGKRSSSAEELVVEVDSYGVLPHETPRENKESLILSIKHGKVQRKTSKDYQK